MQNLHDIPETARETAAAECKVDKSQIEHVFPCTPFQNDFPNGEHVIGQAIFDIAPHTDSDRLRNAWAEVARNTPILRSRVFATSSGSQLQAVLSEDITWTVTNGHKDAVATTEKEDGTHCTKFALVKDPESNCRALVWTFNQVFVDSTVLKSCIQKFTAAYNGEQVPSHPAVEDLLQHIATLDATRSESSVSDIEGSSFPLLPASFGTPNPHVHAEHSFSFAPQACSTDLVLRAALATLISRYMRSVDVAFDVVVERLPSIGPVDAPVRSILPCQVHVDPAQPRSDLLHKLKDEDEAMRKYEQAGLRNAGERALDAQTVLLVTDDDVEATAHFDRVNLCMDKFAPYTARALLLECRVGNGSVLLLARHDPNIMDNAQVHRFLRQLANLVEQYRGDAPLSELDATTQEDLDDIAQWNAVPPPIGTDCIHDLVAKWTVATPHMPAVSAWDGDLTFLELHDLSSRLAVHIHDLKLEKESVVPLCFEKSKWAIVAIMAVLKAGAAFTLIDPSIPPKRIDSICEQVSASVALTCESEYDNMASRVPQCITVDDHLLESLPSSDRSLPAVAPEDLVYIMFTSGSSGQPKGVMAEHRSITSYASSWSSIFRVDNHSRTLQFASYAYAVAVVDIFGSLLTGGCICIPSEHERVNDIAGFVQRSQANYAMLTPSFIGALEPDDVPSLKVLIMAGEPMKPETRDIWAGRVQLLNGCGQSECMFSSTTTIDLDTPDVRLIGRGSANRLWITNPSDTARLAPVGCVGELVVETRGMARGYLDLPELTASKFLTRDALPWYPAGCADSESTGFYRTGDLVRYLSDGRLINVGREDSMVNIRGQRVETGEVEFHVRKILPRNVRVIVEVVKQKQREMLVAFLVGYTATADSQPAILDNTAASNLTNQLSGEIGTYALPSYYVSLGTLPTTATGKTDRRKLRAMGTELLEGGDQEHQQGSHASSDLELKVAELWAQSMHTKAESITMQDNFFDLGGDSIVAIQMVNKARARGLRLKVEDVLQNPLFSDLVASVDQSSGAGSTDHQQIPVSRTGGNEAELSFAQRGLWFLEQLNPGTPAYNVSIAGRVRGPFQIEALKTALQALEERHETLRTVFAEREGMPVQVVLPGRPAADTLQLIDVGSGGSYVDELRRQQTTAFDLRSAPAWRVAVLKVDAEDHVLSIVMHHIISDGWSDQVLRQDLAALYSAAIAGRDPLTELEPLPVQYRDFATWQQHADRQAEQQSHLQYWTEHLTNNTPAELLIDKPRPALPSGLADVVNATIEGSLFERLQSFCKSQQTTLYIALLAAFRAAHYRLTGVEDATIGTPNVGRNHTELEDLVGFFSNTQCMRIKVESETFAQLVQQVKSTVTAALAHNDVPFEKIVSQVLPGARDASRNPLVQLMFAVHSQPSLGEINLEGLSTETLSGTESTRFDVEFHVVQRKQKLTCDVLFAKELFDTQTIQMLVNTFKEVLRRGLEEHDVPILSLPLTDGLEELQNMGLLSDVKTDYPRDSSITSVFSNYARTTPDSIAVKDSSTQLTYAELDQQSNAVASWLDRRSLAPETWIGVLASRSCETIVAFLGILKANLAYVPLDVEAPASRIESILSAFSGTELVLLGSGDQAPQIPGIEGLEFVRVSDTTQGDHNSRTRKQGPSATSLGYVMFTSGSTGKPKGVMIEHRGVVRLVKDTNILSSLPPAMTVAHLFNIAFDLSVWEIYTALLNGGTVVCIDSATKLDPQELERVFSREHIQAAMLPPVLLKTCLASAPSMFKDLAAFYNGADRFDSHDAKAVRRLVPGRVVNAYGPTENSALSTIYDVQQDDHLLQGVPIGTAVSGSGAYVMDVNQKLVSAGVMGELVVTGDGVARGYTDAELDRDRFVEVTIGKDRVKAYRTGDRVRHRPSDGQIEFFGRLDRQAKIRGYRLELAEVEHALLKQDAVDDAAVIISGSEEAEADLLGFVTTSGDDAPAWEEEATKGQVESWSQQFDNNFYQGIDDIDESTLGNDFVGWTSMYDGNRIDRTEMQEWLDETMQTMLDGGPAGRVLEIGTGTGMVLFNLGQGLEYYVGIDPSAPAVDFAVKQAKQSKALADKVEIHVGTASDIDRIDCKGAELVVLNSVVQYFPSREYLADMVEAVARIPTVKRLFLGDIRSHAINDQFLASRAIYKLGEAASMSDIRREMGRLEKREEELLVAPAFFTRLHEQMPDTIQHVEILPKRMKATNELSSYRYGVVIHFKRAAKHEQEYRSVEDGTWVDFSAQGMDEDSLSRLLDESSQKSVVAVSNIPYRKTIMERQVVEMVNDEESDAGSEWFATAKESAKRCAAMSTTDLTELAEQKGFQVEVSWARQDSHKGGQDAIFHRYHSSNGARAKFRFPVDHDRSRSLSNRPLQGLRNLQMERQVRKALQAQLPSYMVPKRITVLEKMPVNANGKVDRKQLASLSESAPMVQTTTADVPPQNEEERALCEEFSSVLGTEIGPLDDFFAMGGHSLMAMRLLPRIRDAVGWHILVHDLYQHSSPRALYEAQHSSAGDENSSDSKWPSYMEAHSASEKSKATLVLVHGFWGQGRVFAGLTPILDKHLDVIILHDPFFGRLEGPRKLDEWSKFYLQQLQERLPPDSQVIIGGYSFGGFVALQMASMWKDWFQSDLVSLLLLDPAVYEAVDMDKLSPEFLEEKVNYGLRLFGEEQRDFVMEHFKKFGPLMASPRGKPAYAGRGLHIASSEVAAQGVQQWWADNYPQLEQECIDSTHHGLFEWATASEQVGQAINRHCSRVWSERERESESLAALEASSERLCKRK